MVIEGMLFFVKCICFVFVLLLEIIVYWNGIVIFFVILIMKFNNFLCGIIDVLKIKICGFFFKIEFVFFGVIFGVLFVVLVFKVKVIFGFIRCVFV